MREEPAPCQMMVQDALGNDALAVERLYIKKAQRSTVDWLGPLRERSELTRACLLPNGPLGKALRLTLAALRDCCLCQPGQLVSVAAAELQLCRIHDRVGSETACPGEAGGSHCCRSGAGTNRDFFSEIRADVDDLDGLHRDLWSAHISRAVGSTTRKDATSMKLRRSCHLRRQVVFLFDPSLARL